TPHARRRARRVHRAPLQTFGKLTLHEITESKDGYKWTTYMVQGWSEPGVPRGRKKFKTRSEAEAFMTTKGVEMANADTSLHSIATRLTKEQVAEAEAAFTRLAGRHPLGE